jgi:hypothetical protein
MQFGDQREIVDALFELLKSETEWAVIMDRAAQQAPAKVFPVTAETKDCPTVDQLLEQRCEQTSRKYRGVARLPPGMTGLQALKAYAANEYKRVMQDAESRAADVYRTYIAQKRGDHFTLSKEAFREFLLKTGRKVGKFELEGPPCEECGTLGDVHAHSCISRTERKKRRVPPDDAPEPDPPVARS